MKKHLGVRVSVRERLAQSASYAPARPEPAQRPSIVSDGCELEPVWFPHRDAKSLLPELFERRTGAPVSRGRHVSPKPRSL